MERRRAILAVRPQLAEALVTGEKQVEFRRTRPRFEAGDTIYVYATSPVQAVIGSFTCGSIIEASPTRLWRHYANGSEITRAYFREYFNGTGKGYAIQATSPNLWSSPLTLDTLRQLIPGFHPPQSYRFLPRGLDLAAYR